MKYHSDAETRGINKQGADTAATYRRNLPLNGVKQSLLSTLPT